MASLWGAPNATTYVSTTNTNKVETTPRHAATEWLKPSRTPTRATYASRRTNYGSAEKTRTAYNLKKFHVEQGR